MPVRIAITDMPPGVPLVSGMTATVSIRRDANDSLSLRDRLSRAWSDVRETQFPSPPVLGCSQSVNGESGTVSTLSTPHHAARLSPSELNTGLTPGMSIASKR